MRTGRRWHGPISLDDVLRVDILASRGGTNLSLQPRRTRVAGTAIGTGRGAAGRYRDLSEFPVRYVLIPGWALRDGTLARLIHAALSRRADVRYGKGVRETLTGWATAQRKR